MNLQDLIKTIVEESVMNEKAKTAFTQLLHHMSRLQHTEATVIRMRNKSQQFKWIGFPKSEGRWLVHEANLFPGAVNEKTNSHT